MIQTVISDLGKVLLWFDNGIFFRKMTAYCLFSEDKIREVAHRRLEVVSLFDKGKIGPKEFYSRIITQLKAKISFEDFKAIYCDVFLLNPPVHHVLKQLRNKYRLILLSNTDILRFGFIKKKFPEILIFDHYILSFEIGRLKPDPKIYQEALKRTQSEARESVFIDDMEENITAARKLGFKAFQYKPDTDLEKAFRSLGLTF